jgi:site-specific recombinase XerD
LHHRPIDVAKITREDIQGFLTHLQGTRSQATAHNRFRALRAFFNFMGDGADERILRREPLGVIERSPMRRMAPPKRSTKLLLTYSLRTRSKNCGTWPKGRARASPRRRDAAIIRMFLATGIRAGEMANLRLDDLDRNRQIARVGGKGRKYRHVPYSGAAATSLDRYLVVRGENKFASRADHVWLGIKGHMTRSGLQQMLERVGKRTGIEDLYPHRLRHVFVDACFTNGMSESEVMALMGWSTSAMCRRYASARRTQRAIESYRRLGIGDPHRRAG